MQSLSFVSGFLRGMPQMLKPCRFVPMCYPTPLGARAEHRTDQPDRATQSTRSITSISLPVHLSLLRDESELVLIFCGETVLLRPRAIFACLSGGGLVESRSRLKLKGCRSSSSLTIFSWIWGLVSTTCLSRLCVRSYLLASDELSHLIFCHRLDRFVLERNRLD